MQYTLNRGEKGRVEVKVDISKVAFVAAYGDIVEVISRDQKFPGFRPGKIPVNVIEDKIGVNKILNDAASFLVTKHLDEIFKKENITALGSPNIAVHSLAKDSPFSFTATLTAKPQVKLGDWKKLKVKRVKPKEVAEKDVSESIKNIHEAYQKQKVAKGTEETKESEGAGDGQPSFAKASEGQGKFIYDARGNKVFFKEKTKVAEESKGSKDGIDDEFAKKIGARDLKHLQELVRVDLEKIMADQVEAKLENELFDEILKLAEVEVPDILIDDEINRIVVRITQNLEQQNKKLDDYLKEENTTLDALRAKLRPQAENNVKITLIMDEIGKKEKVQVTREEIENAAKGVDQAKLDEKQKADLRNYMAVSIFQAKTLDLVKKAVAI
ncbi:MAG: Trigger factor [Candidatus Curtissbacteria bacterium GW2011_GWA1_41_11]|uniref:Trigger factor n=1 Tax=Candidatus Curtissbacteria bacterium GW2011_GWA1_41_11 TaxID=1618409 RepID=A0A0G0UGA0_9BACT|nr:MAG: Trigger factor [Candidatus Curtissbacteria bacterium GW2011_GWA1_41_11]